MSDTAKKQVRKLKIIEDDPNLSAFESDLNERVRHFKQRKKELLAPGQTLTEFASGHLYYGFHKVKGGWVYREWAPGATAMHLIGDFNNWNRTSHPMKAVGNGNWEIEIPGVRTLKHRSKVKVAVTSPRGTEDRIPLYATYVVQDEKTHNFSAAIWNPRKEFVWTDEKFRPKKNVPPLIYEAHVGMATEEERVGTYLEFMRDILPRIKKDGYNTVQLMAIMEHPYYASFGYQVSNFFAASSWYGTPDDLKALINEAHALGLSVLLDLVHSHAVKNTAEGINGFDGRDDQFFKAGGAGDHPAWGSKVFDYGKNGVVHFLLSNVRFWLEEYHVDGLRVDAVASMLYLDYGRENGRWTPNINGGHENLEAIDFLRALNEMAFSVDPNALMVAEESTAWPLVTRPAKDGGLGFNLKWNMGWMNDMCHYLKLDPWFRQFHHKDITFSLMYAFSENFVLPISHDEVVHMKGSLRGKMPGDDWQQLAGVRAFTAYLLAHPGKKLTFMGAELGQWHEWNFASQLDWYLLENKENQQTQRFFKDINRFYLSQSPRWDIDFSWEGFEWLVADDNHNNVVVFVRRDRKGRELIAAVNFSPVGRADYRFGVPPKKTYREVFTTDLPAYGGTGDWRNEGELLTESIPSHGKPCSLCVTIPPLGAVFFAGEGEWQEEEKTNEPPEV